MNDLFISKHFDSLMLRNGVVTRLVICTCVMALLPLLMPLHLSQQGQKGEPGDITDVSPHDLTQRSLSFFNGSVLIRSDLLGAIRINDSAIFVLMAANL